MLADPAFLLDTNICVYLLDGNAPVLLRRVQGHARGSLVASSIAFAEVLIGAVKRGSEEEALRFFDHIPVLAFDERAAHRYAQVPFRRGGFDRLIAAHAMSLGLTLVTNNERDFEGVPGLAVENWTR